MFYTQKKSFVEQRKEEEEINFAFLAFAKTLRETRRMLKDNVDFKKK